MTGSAGLECRILVLAPSGRDAALGCQVLEQAQIAAVRCEDATALFARLNEGAAAALVAAEALTPDVIRSVEQFLAAQPAWSDFPLLILTNRAATAGENRRTLEGFASLGNITALERPFHPLTLVSAARAVLRARDRQYAARRELANRDRDVKQRDEFLALLGHELRNPLGAMRNAATLAERLASTVPGLDRPLGIINRQLRHLTQLVDDLLDVARVTSGKIALKLVPVDLAGLTRAMVEEMEKASRERRLLVELRVPDERLVVMGDPVRLEQIFNNLLTNALKYTPAHGRIDVSVGREGEEAVLRVADTGVGIGPDMLPTIFEPFTQAARTLDRSQGGIGLGLSVVRGLARLHGGEVAVKSEGLGRGSEFVVRLPLASVDVGAAASEEPPAAPTHVVRNILIVEDGADNRESLQELLEAQGHQVHTAADGERGVEQALAVHPDVALVDIGLPLLDGYEVARRIRGAMGSQIFLIALTGYGQPDDRARAAAAGFDVHITKPLDFRVLERLIGSSSPRSPSDSSRSAG